MDRWMPCLVGGSSEQVALGHPLIDEYLELDCAFETVCETCVHFATDVGFQPVLLRQRDHAAERDHRNLVTVYDRLLSRIEGDDDSRREYAGEDHLLDGSPA